MCLLNNFIKAFFYGNIYLGFYAVALCIETNVVNNISLNIFPFYLIIFFCTSIYYTMIYVRSAGAKNYNDRTLWYRRNLDSIKKVLRIAIILTCTFLLIFLIRNLQTLNLLTTGQLLVISAFPLIAAWYTFSPKKLGLKKIRQIGWIKPFIVGLTWSGWVTLYPILIWQIQRKQDFNQAFLNTGLLWMQNFLFCSVNAIIFDIKDYRNDLQHHLKTYAVILGIRNTYRFIVIPVVILNLIVFFLYQKQQHFSLAQTLIQLIPYILLTVIISKQRQQKTLLYYLVAVDGLVFVKALCGITSILFFKK